MVESPDISRPPEGSDERLRRIDEYAEKLRQRGCDHWCGVGIDAPPWKHRPICAVRILNPPPWNYGTAEDVTNA